MVGLGKSRLLLIVGVAVFVAALAGLLLTGRESIQPSADSDDGISLWSAVVPALAAIVLIRLIPMRAPTLAIRTIGDSNKQLRWLIGIAVGFPLLWYAFALAGVDRTKMLIEFGVSTPNSMSTFDTYTCQPRTRATVYVVSGVGGVVKRALAA